MKKLAKKYGFVFIVLTVTPAALFVKLITKGLLLETAIISLQIPFIALQALSLFIIIYYRKEVFE